MADVKSGVSSVILINWLLNLVAIGGSRMIGRWLLSSADNRKNRTVNTNVIIYGAGSAGRQLAIALLESVEYKLVAFIDNNVEYVEAKQVSLFPIIPTVRYGFKF